MIERCSNFKGDGHPASAPPGCYEADPKGGLPKACPAPVAQVAPALPGSVTLLKPQGERLPQRPRPGGPQRSAPKARCPKACPAPTSVPPPTGE